jgi:hypothetical protein
MRPPLHKGGLQGGGWDCTYYLPLTPSLSKEEEFRNFFTDPPLGKGDDGKRGDLSWRATNVLPPSGHSSRKL